jgi:LysM repeat protein
VSWTRILLIAGFSVSVITPLFVSARSQGITFSRTPEVIETNNSQTMALLSAPLNIDPSVSSHPILAIVDGSALSSEGDNNGTGTTFIDAGKSGTGQISVYVVRKGDTLGSIAKMFGVSTNTITWANNIKGGVISEGDQLVILPVSGVKHTVKKGDTLQSIATLYKVDINDILSYNDITTLTKLNTGDIIIVPDGELATITTPSKSKGKLTEPLLLNINNYPTYAGYYMRPINGGRKSQGLHGYNAVDLAAPVGTPIYAAADGTVIISRTGGYNGGYGTYVVISHPNGTQTVYGHMSKNLTSVGEHVAQGQQIGAIGMTGKTTGPHVHFEIRGAQNPF